MADIHDRRRLLGEGVDQDHHQQNSTNDRTQNKHLAIFLDNFLTATVSNLKSIDTSDANLIMTISNGH
jgi:hypothetical protein